jgi:thymidylate kinase
MGSENDHASTTSRRPFMITFSGIDGAGKTTQIEYLTSHLEAFGLRVLRLIFWDHVAVLPKMRAEVGYRSVDVIPAASPAEVSFTPKNNKHIRRWYLTAARSGLYMLDVLQLRSLINSELIRDSDVVIFDRYIYDQIANVYSQSFASRIYGRMLLSCAPVPDLAFILDASPLAAFTRKPEYPLEFMYRNRQNFLSLRSIAPYLITISGDNAEDVCDEIHAHISRSRLFEARRHQANYRAHANESGTPAAELL